MRKVPQKSAPIIHEIIEKLACTRLSSYEFNIIFAIIRKTYGWQQKEDWISLSQLSGLTNIAPQHCCRTLKKLISKKIVIKNGSNLGINKNINAWTIPKQVLPIQVLPIQVFTTTQIGNLLLPKQVDTKETITKETITKETTMSEIEKIKKNKKVFNENSEEIRLSNVLLALIKGRHEKFREPDLQKWAAEVEKMIRIDGRTPQEIEVLIMWTQQDKFWKSNILSTGKLREKFDQLWIKAQAEFEHQKIDSF